MYLDSTGSLIVYNDIAAFSSASDIKLKTNIKPLNIDCIDLINKIKPVEFTWKDIKDVPDNKKNTIDHGFISQEVEEILQLLIKDTNNYKIFSEIDYIKTSYQGSRLEKISGLYRSQYQVIKMCEYYSSSRYMGKTGNKDPLGREKPFYNIVNYIYLSTQKYLVH
jgi:hypothetical protein